MFPYRTYLSCFLLGALVVLVVAPLLARFAFRIGAVDRAVNRKIHQRTMPRLGGLSLFFGMWVPIVLLGFYDNLVIRQVLAGEGKLLLIMLGGLAMLVVGMIDDICGLDAKWKFGIQFPVAIALVAAGVKFDTVSFPYLGQLELGALGPLVSVFWLVGVTNALNLIDGIDGLASGVSYLIATSIAILSLQGGSALLVVVMSALAGACLGFLRYNLHPARIFLGDSGSLFLGMTLAVSATLGSVKEQLGASLLLPVILMGYPIADTLLAMVRRFLRGKSMFTGDASHIHHRLLNKGLDHRRACLVIYGVCLTFCLWTFAIARQNLPLMILGTVVVCAVSVAGVYYLGYLNYFRSPQGAGERNHFKAAHHFAEMIKVKLRLAGTRDDVFHLLQQVWTEFKQPALEIDLPEGPLGDAIAFPSSPQPFRAQPMDVQTACPEPDRYQFDETGLVVRAYYAPGTGTDELVIEERRLFEEICETANNRLARILQVASKTKMQSDSRPNERTIPAGAARLIAPARPGAMNSLRHGMIVLRFKATRAIRLAFSVAPQREEKPVPPVPRVEREGVSGKG